MSSRSILKSKSKKDMKEREQSRGSSQKTRKFSISGISNTKQDNKRESDICSTNYRLSSEFNNEGHRRFSDIEIPNHMIKYSR